MVETVDDRVALPVSVKKWEKGKSIILRIQVELVTFGLLDYKQLEKDRGFLVYISRTYKNMCPYLKGIHQTMDSLQAGRDKDSWMMNRRELLAAITSNYGEVILEN